MATQIINVAPEYTLKYDGKGDELRDRTYSELINEYGRNTMIKCLCMNREYPITSQWVKTHLSCQKHNHWKTEQQNQHIKTHGHCVSAEAIVDQQAKELRQYKKMYSQATNELEKKEIKISTLTNELKQIKQEKKELKTSFDDTIALLNQFSLK